MGAAADIDALRDLGDRLAHIAGTSQMTEWPENVSDSLHVLGNLVELCGKQIALQRQSNLRQRKLLDERIPIERYKTEFLKNISHELRTPLASIEGFAAALLRGMEQKADDRSEEMPRETRRRFLNIITQEAKRLGELIENMLEMADIETRHPDRKKSLLRVKDLFLGAVSTFRSHWGEDKAAHVRMAVSPTGDGPRVYANRDAVLEILRHLLDNAHNFSGGQEIVLGAEPLIVQKQNGSLQLTRIWVQDRGIGIPPSEQPLLFTKFHRIETAAHTVPGTGLGLSIVWALVNQNNGSISVESNVGEGSTFTVILPAEAQTEA
jgi:signal transduction histidine kinase